MGRSTERAIEGKGGNYDIGGVLLRRSSTSLLKNAGVSDVVTRDIVSHENEAVSRNYTHIDAETKRAALDKLPDVTSA